MKRLAILACCIGLISIFNILQAQNDIVTLEIIDTDNTKKEIKLNLPDEEASINEWNYSVDERNESINERNESVNEKRNDSSYGSNKSVMDIVNEKLSENDIDCPPEREKISENIWKCGNGKKIRTTDERLGRILSLAWDN